MPASAVSITHVALPIAVPLLAALVTAAPTSRQQMRTPRADAQSETDEGLIGGSGPWLGWVPVVALIAAAVACARLPDEATIDIGGTTLAIGPIARANALFACGAGAVVALLGTVQHRSVGHGIFASVVASSLVIGAFAGDMARVGGAGVHVAMMVAAMAMALGDSGGVGAGQSGWRAATAYLTLGSLGLVIIVAGLSLADVLRVNPGGLVTESFVIAVLAAGFALAIGLPPVHFWVPVVSWRPDIGSSTLVLGVVVPATVGYLVQVLAGLPQLGGAALTARLLTVAGLLACIVGALGATSPGTLGRRVGYASIAGIGPTLLGLGMATRIGAAGALVALAHHAACMIVLVATTGAVERDAGSTPIRGSLAGAVSDGQTPLDQHATASGRNNRVERWRSGRRLHRIAFILATLAASGIPPLSGFASRWAIMQALSLADWRLAMVVGITSLVTLAALLTSAARRSPSQADATPYHLPEAGGASNEAMRGDGGGLLVVYSLVTCVWGFVPAWVIEQTWRATAQLGYLRPF